MRGWATLVFLVSVAAPAAVTAQEPERRLPGRPIPPRSEPAGECVLDQPASGTVTRSQQGPTSVIHVQEVVIHCEGGAEIRADEADIYQGRGESHLYGNVLFQDTVRRLTSDNAVYTTDIGRLYATGDVEYTDLSTGSSLRGPNLEYFRPMEGRPDPRLIATQRPRVTLVPESEDSVPAEPIQIDSDRTTIDGDVMTAEGSVVIQRSDLDAWSDRARYDRSTGNLVLEGRARMEGETYELTGDHILAVVPPEGIESLTSRGNATLSSEDMQVAAPELRLFFENDLLQRLVAVTTRTEDASSSDRATVSATGFRLEADSIDALTPAQQLEQVIAIGMARGESIDTIPAEPVVVRPDSADSTVVTPDSAAIGGETVAFAMDRDWIAGDTVIGYFSTVPDTAVPDTAPAAPSGDQVDAGAGGSDQEEDNVRLDRLVAKGSARALYRVREDEAEASASDTRPSLNYLSGQAIELSFAEGELTVAQVSGLKRGVYLDPVPPEATTEEAEEDEEDSSDENPPVGRGRDRASRGR